MNLKILNELDRILKSNPSLATNLPAFCQVINGVFDTEFTSIDTADLTTLTGIIDHEVLSRYFSRVWQPETKKYKYSGLSIIDEVNAMNPEMVIDIGCGYNEFKGKIKNLVGLDPYNDRADYKVSLDNFECHGKFDIAICLGSINFGCSQTIIRQMTKAISLVKPSGLLYFRVNPGKQHDAPESRWINFYDWDPVFISNIAEYLNCELLALRQDIGDRFYFVLRKRDK